MVYPVILVDIYLHNTSPPYMVYAIFFLQGVYTPPKNVEGIFLKKSYDNKKRLNFSEKYNWKLQFPVIVLMTTLKG